MPALVAVLLKRGYAESDRKKILGENHLRQARASVVSRKFVNTNRVHLAFGLPQRHLENSKIFWLPASRE